jgi:acyl carrier protein
VDNQVKIRGFRIELGEVESVLREHPEVFDACIAIREGGTGGPRLVAYVVLSRQSHFSLDHIRNFLKQRLPGYMVPVLCPLDRLPLTPNGKLDRHALPDPGVALADREETPETPEELPAAQTNTLDPVEQAVAAIWTDILNVQRIRVDDNFFDLGGHSLLAARMVARLEKELGLRMKPKELAFQTLGQFAASCREHMQCR